jgi:hypothetical protein
MRRGVALYIVGSGVLLSLVGCGRIAMEQREPWRREAEVTCLQSGAVKESAARVAITSINGPGICGAEHPFKVTALGDRTILGYFGESRPPADVPRGFPIPPPRQAQAPAYSPPAYPAASQAAPMESPMSIHAPGTESMEDEEPEAPEIGQLDVPGARPPPAYPSRSQERAQAYPSGAPNALPRLGPSQGNALQVSAASVSPAATLACPLVSRLDHWMVASVQPSAQRWFGQPVIEIKQISAYSCRGMNGQRGAHISEHAFGNALDIAAFVLADGRRITVKNGWHGAPEEQGFLRDVHASACENFSTVLAPGSNRFHYDHIHVDLARRRSGRVVCNPRAVPGDLIARRAQDRMATGSVGRHGGLGFAPEQERSPALDELLPRAIPGQD